MNAAFSCFINNKNKESMERRSFVKKSSILTAGILGMSSLTSFASKENENSNIDLVPFLASKKIELKGIIVDSKTGQALKNTSMKVRLKRNRFIATQRVVENNNGKYSIVSGFTSNGKFSEKIEIEIKAPGYKTYNGQLLLSQNGCNIHSAEWDYNPEFKLEFLPENLFSGDDVFTQFNFRLVK